MLAAVCFGLLGCTPPASSEGVQARCQGQDIPDWASVSQVLAQLDLDCAQALADPVGMTASRDARTAEGWMTAGLYLLWSDREMALVEDWGHPQLPELAFGQMADGVEAQGLAWEDPAGLGWYAYVLQAVREVRTETMDEALASFVGGTLTVDVALPNSLDQADLRHPIGPALIWVHEATHLRSNHVACPTQRPWEGGCDATEEGAYGVGAFYLRRWMGRHPEAVWDCQAAVDQAACGRILARSEDWSICEELSERCAEDP